MPLKTQSKGTSFTIIAEGEFKIDDVSESCDIIKKVFDKKPTAIAFDFSAVTGADISFLQLICSAHKEAHDSGVDIKASSLPADMTDKINELGFLQPDACMAGDMKFCLWATGGNNG